MCAELEHVVWVSIIWEWVFSTLITGYILLDIAVYPVPVTFQKKICLVMVAACFGASLLGLALTWLSPHDAVISFGHKTLQTAGCMVTP